MQTFLSTSIETNGQERGEPTVSLGVNAQVMKNRFLNASVGHFKGDAVYSLGFKIAF